MSPKKPNPEIIQKLKQAAVYLQREHLPQAESLLRGVLMAEPGNPDALHLMGGVSLRRGRLDEAAALFDRSAEAGCSDPGLHIRLGVTRRALGQAEMAEAAFARAAGLARHLAGPALAQFARMLMSSGRPAESAALFRISLARSPKDPAAHEGLAASLEELGDLDGAIGAYRRAIELTPELMALHYNLANSLKTAGRHQESIDHYEKALTLAPDFAEAAHNLGEVLQAAGRFEDAIAAYRRALELKPNLVQSYNSLAFLLKESGRLEEAIEICEKAITIDPEFAEAHSNLGNIYQLNRCYEKSIPAYRRAIELRPDFAVIRTNLAEACRALGRLDEAEALLREALTMDPAMLRAYVDLGIVLLQKGEAGAAMESCGACLSRAPGNSAALALMVTVLEELDDGQSARELADLSRFIRLSRIAVPTDFGDLHTFNIALIAHVEQHPSLIYAPISHTTRGGKQSGELICEPKGPVAHLEAAIGLAVERYIAAMPDTADHPFLANRPKAWRLTLWATILESQGHQVPHIHPAGWLSGVYYAQVPGSIPGNSEQEGWLEFGRSGLEYATTVEPETRLIEPLEGLMVLFPSYFYHCTVPFRSEERRISFAFDLLPA